MTLNSVTPAQGRILSHMGERYPDRWCLLIDLDLSRLLEEDDVIVVPSLAEAGLLLHDDAREAVLLTASGMILAEEIRASCALSARKKQNGRTS